MNTNVATNPEEFCVNHPWRKTALRCNRCSKAVCKDCIVLMPVGYRCKQCIKEQQKVYENIRWSDYVISALLAAFIVGVSSFLTIAPPFCIVFVVLSPMVGIAVAESIAYLFRNRRGRYLRLAAFGGVAIGGMGAIAIVLLLLSIGYTLSFFGTDLLLTALVVVVLHTFICFLTLWLWFSVLRRRNRIDF